MNKEKEYVSLEVSVEKEQLLEKVKGVKSEIIAMIKIKGGFWNIIYLDRNYIKEVDIVKGEITLSENFNFQNDMFHDKVRYSIENISNGFKLSNCEGIAFITKEDKDYIELMKKIGKEII